MKDRKCQMKMIGVKWIFLVILWTFIFSDSLKGRKYVAIRPSSAAMQNMTNVTYICNKTLFLLITDNISYLKEWYIYWKTTLLYSWCFENGKFTFLWFNLTQEDLGENTSLRMCHIWRCCAKDNLKEVELLMMI